MTAHEIHALAGAYAVDALDDLERVRFEAHLAVCAECRAEVDSLQDATLMLSSMTSVAPSAALRDAILADIKKVRPIPPAVAMVEKRRPRRWSTLVAAAAVLGVVGAGGVVLDQVRNDTAPSQGESNLAADRVLRAADVQHYNLSLGRTSATVFRSVSVGRAVLVARSMDAAPDGKVYQLWLLKNGRMVSAGMMHGGEKESTVLLQGNANDATGAGITIEPEGGSVAPTTPPIAEFEFA